MGELFCAVVELLAPATVDGSQDTGYKGTLTRLMQPAMKRKQVQEILYNVMDHKGDELQGAYNDDDARLAAMGREWLDAYVADPAQHPLLINIYSNDPDPKHLQVELTRTLEDLLPRIIKVREEQTDRGQPVKLEQIDFAISKAIPSGLYLVEAFAR